MKKNIFIYSLIMLMSCTVLAQHKITKELGDFSEIKVFDGISVVLIQSDQNKVEITGEDSNDVVIVNKKDKLKIRMRVKKIFSGYMTYVKVYYKNRLHVIDVNESAKITAEENIKEDVGITLRAQEGGIIDIPIEVQRLQVKSISGGEIKVRGISKTQEIHTGSAGFYKAKALITEQTTVSCVTGGSAKIYASEYVNAKAKAGGIVHIYGNPKLIEKQTFLGGKILEK